MPDLFGDLLKRFLSDAGYTVEQLAALSGVPKRTIYNWHDGISRKPQQWQGLIRVARALDLNEAQATQLLAAARHPSPRQLLQQTLHSEDRHLLEDFLAFSPLQPKGSRDKAQTPFVGRESQMTQLMEHLRHACKGKGRVVFVRGEAGSGKTALMQQLADQAQDAHRSLVVCAARCATFVGTGDAYQPFRSLLNQLCGDDGGLESIQVSAAGRQRIRNSFAEIARILLGEGRPLLNTFVSVPALLHRLGEDQTTNGELRKQLEALRSFWPGPSPGIGTDAGPVMTEYTAVLTRIAQRCPLLLLIDDMQWADTSSLNLLFHLARSIQNSRIMVVASMRTGEPAAMDRERPQLLSTLVHHCQQMFGSVMVDLDQATDDERNHLVNDLLDIHNNNFDEEFRRQMMAYTNGNPFFVLEILKELVERNDLVSNEKQEWTLSSYFHWRFLPARVEGVLAARLQLQDSVAEKILSVASAIGYEFNGKLIAHVLGQEIGTVIHYLSHILERQHLLITPLDALAVDSVAGAALDHFYYRFRHHLFLEYVYARQSDAERRHIHGLIAGAMEQLSPNRLDSMAVDLARHWREAGNWDKTIQYLESAARNALHLCAYTEAFEHLQDALALLSSHIPASLERDRREMPLQAMLTVVLTGRYGFVHPEVKRCAERTFDLCVALGDTSSALASAVRGRWSYHLLAGEPNAAWQVATDYRSMALDSGPLHALMSSQQLAPTYMVMGKQEEADLEYIRAIEIIEQLETLNLRKQGFTVTEPQAITYCFRAINLWLRGFVDQAQLSLARGLQSAQASGHLFSIAYTHGIGAFMWCVARDPVQAQKVARSSLTLSKTYGFGITKAVGMTIDGWATALLENQLWAEEAIIAGIELWERLGFHILKPVLLSGLADIRMRRKDWEGSAQVVEQLFSEMSASGDNMILSDIYHMHGQIALQQNQPEKAEEIFLSAIDIARSQGSVMLALRSANDLARLWHGHNKVQEAANLLNTCLHSIAEPGDALDVKTAMQIRVAMQIQRNKK